MEQLYQDLKNAVRMLAKNPVVTAAAVLSLALGIGANITIFSLLNAVLLRAVPVAEPDSQVMVGACATRISFHIVEWYSTLWDKAKVQIT